MIIPSQIWREMLEHCKQQSPIEACGYLAGTGSVVKKAYRLTNVDRSAEHFSMDPKEQFAVVKDARAGGLELLAVYHSHPNSPARMSDEDLRLAVAPDIEYAIISLNAVGAGVEPLPQPRIRSFKMIEGKPIEQEVVIQETKGTFRIPESVIEDTRAFRHEVEKFLAGETSPIAFKAIRVPMGIYEQRENDTYMVRVRGAGGVFLPHQIERIAELSEKYGSGIAHVTVRQDIQIHRVLVQDLPDVLESLLEVELSPRGGGGNTIRNVTACPLAGACADEVFDVTPYALALTEYLLADRANFNLPRKFKVSFSGCSKDCGLASVGDVGFFAHEREGTWGFAVYAGGGMGAHSALGIPIENFVPADAVFEVTEAVKRLFDKHGDRANKHKARLRFVLERVGKDEFRRLYREELQCTQREEIVFPEIKLQEPQAEQTAIRVHLPLGDISASALKKLAPLAEFGDGTIRGTQDQDLLLRCVPASRLPEIHAALKAIDEAFVTPPPVKCVACAGASTCKLGLCRSKGLADAIVEKLEGLAHGMNEPLRISGCPNSCGQHPIAPLGLFGGAMRVDGKLMPVYSILTGGRMVEGKASLSRVIAKVPAKAVPALLREFWVAVARNRLDGETDNEMLDRWGTGYLRELAQTYSAVPSYDKAPEYYQDYHEDVDFSLAGRGPGECGAGVMDVIQLDIDEAKRALKKDKLYDSIVFAARALLVTRGLEPKKDREVFDAFKEHLIEPRWVNHTAQDLLALAIDSKLDGSDALSGRESDVRALIARVEELYLSLDSNLKFRVEPIRLPVESESGNGKASAELDLRGVACPMNFVRAKVYLEQLETGAVLDILLDDGEPVRNVPASFAEQGQEVISVTGEGAYHRVRVRKIS